MIYKAIGLMSGSSLDGLDITFVELQEISGKWSYTILKTDCIDYQQSLLGQLKNAINLPALEYQLLHSEYGNYLGEQVNHFIEKNRIEHQVSLIASHGHTTFHLPEKRMTHQLGDGAVIAAITRLPVISDLRALDVAFGGQGAPIVPFGEKLLFPEHHFFLNIGGIANISAHGEKIVAFDICAANRVLNMLANEEGFEYDDQGKIAAGGQLNTELLNQLNALEYYRQPYPKSLSNTFGTDVVFPLTKSFGTNTADALHTYTEHISLQIKDALKPFLKDKIQTLLITGGGAFNLYLIERLSVHLKDINFKIELPDEKVIKYKEALIMALLGVLRWREQYTVSASVTGAKNDSIGGALWLGGEA